MTLEQACGIVCNTVDKRTGRELDHREIYARYIDYLGGLDKVKQYIPISLKELRRAYKKDRLFNNTGLGLWQNAAGYTAGDPICFFGGIWTLYRQNDIDVASCAQGVCILKEAARMLIERGET